MLRYLAEERDYVLELEELADLAKSLLTTEIEMSQAFVELFDQAVDETVDALNVNSFDRGVDPGQEISDWLEQIEEIENYSPHAMPYFKKRELAERLDQIGQAEEASLRRHAASGRQPTSSPSRASTTAPSLSDAALSSMFSSLRKPE